MAIISPLIFSADYAVYWLIDIDTPLAG